MTVPYKLITDSYLVQQVRTERFKTLKWSASEKLLKDRPKHVQDFFKRRRVALSVLADIKFKRSLFGIFLHTYNKNVVQDYFLNDNKLAMMNYDMRTYTDSQLQHLKEDNDFSADLRELLEKAVSEKDVIDYDFLYDNIYALKFCDTPLTFIDSELLKFRRLKVLILCGNWITEIAGHYLPKSLEYIELFANQIEYVQNFACKAPKSLIHIGFKRNWLTNESRLHLLGNAHKFGYLQSLDLSENDIYDLEDVLTSLASLRQLMCFQLQGNPCAVTAGYKDEVLRVLPWLVQLDCTEILEVDKVIAKEPEIEPDAAIIFTCHRILSLPKPKKEKGIQQWFYFSISMPLLEDVIEIAPARILEEPDKEVKKSGGKKEKKKKEKGASSKTDTSKTKKKSGAASSKGSGGGGSPYNAADEYAAECRQRVVDTTFRTARFGWEKIIQLPEEALVIKSAERNFADIRDTFRSSVRVKLIYLEVQPSVKAKKTAGKKDKGKGKSKKTEETLTEVSSDIISSVDPDNEPLEEPKETILKKITLASFDCDLHSINWSDKTIDYIWANLPKFQSTGNAVEVAGSLRRLEYSDKAKPKGGQSKKVDNAGDKSEGNETVEKQAIPKALTIQVGFGLVRNYFQT